MSSVCGGAALVALVHWVGKKKLSLVALAGSAACCFVVAVYSYVILGPGGATTEAMPWIPLTMIILMAFFNSLFFYIPWNWLSEMFPFRYETCRARMYEYFHVALVSCRIIDLLFIALFPSFHLSFLNSFFTFCCFLMTVALRFLLSIIIPFFPPSF